MGGRITFQVHTREAIRDFKQYDKNTQNGFANVMVKFSNRIANRQRDTLRSRVKKWTGFLGNAIEPKKVSWREYHIGPLAYIIDKGRGVYDEYIEIGGGSFSGYHYVRNSAKGIHNSFTRAVQKIIVDSQKK